MESSLIGFSLIKIFVKRNRNGWRKLKLIENVFGHKYFPALFNRFNCEGNFTDVTIHYNFKLVLACGCDDEKKNVWKKSVLCVISLLAIGSYRPTAKNRRGKLETDFYWCQHNVWLESILKTSNWSLRASSK